MPFNVLEKLKSIAMKNKFHTQLEITQTKLNKEWVSLREIYENQENYDKYFHRPFQGINYLAEYALQSIKRKNPKIQRKKINGVYHYNQIKAENQ